MVFNCYHLLMDVRDAGGASFPLASHHARTFHDSSSIVIPSEVEGSGDLLFIKNARSTLFRENSAFPPRTLRIFR
jgi:hypothetical protein